MIKKLIFIILIYMCLTITIGAKNVRISQIDPSEVLFNQKVNLYVSITDHEGTPVKGLTKENFTVFESPDNKDFVELTDSISVQEGINNNDGVHYLLLVDNSGSMYFDMFGRRTDDVAKQRMTIAKNAVRSFLDKMNTEKDRVGLAVYNSYFTAYSEPTGEISTVYDYLDEIEKPKDNEGWSEIYSSLYLAIENFSTIRGRKVIIILSDGRNLPFFENAKQEHEVFGNKVFEFSEPMTTAQEEGISVYAINFGRDKDMKLKEIAVGTGGTIFDAYDEDELKGVYQKINEQIMGEYLVSYKADTVSAVKKYVRLALVGSGHIKDTTRFYFASSLFGLAPSGFNPLLFIPLLLALVLMFFLSRLKFTNKIQDASLEVLSTIGGRAATKLVTLNKGQTIIGSSQNAGMTIVGNADIKQDHARIDYDEKKNQYTVISDEYLRVNNKKVKTRVLEPGDVIDVGGATIVFDEGQFKK